MKKHLIFFSILSTLVFVSCSTQNVTNKFPYGNYSYQSFNIVGEVVGEGSLYISKVDSNFIEGNWSIRNIKNCVVCGPQYGSGYFTGRIDNDSIYVNLNPDNPENYVELIGEIKDESFSGDWRWFELVLNSNRGNFKAVRQ